MPALAVGAVVGALVISSAPGVGQSQTIDYRAPRTAAGKPDLNGIWQAVNTANWDLEDHVASAGPIMQLGAAYAVPQGMGVVEGGTIPYRPEAVAKKREFARNALTEDAEIKCYLTGVPRIMY